MSRRRCISTLVNTVAFTCHSNKRDLPSHSSSFFILDSEKFLELNYFWPANILGRVNEEREQKLRLKGSLTLIDDWDLLKDSTRGFLGWQDEDPADPFNHRNPKESISREEYPSAWSDPSELNILFTALFFPSQCGECVLMGIFRTHRAQNTLHISSATNL